MFQEFAIFTKHYGTGTGRLLSLLHAIIQIYAFTFNLEVTLSLSGLF